jgi:hypothetical protein
MGFPHRRRLVTLLDVGLMPSGGGPGGGGPGGILDGLGVWYRADQGAYSQTAAEILPANTEWLSVANNPSVQVGGGGSWTMGGWVYFNAMSGTANLIIAKRPPDASVTNIEFQAHTATGIGLANGVSNGAAFFPVNTAASGPIVAGGWHFWVGGYDSATSTISAQVNNAAIVTAGVTGIPAANAHPVMIGIHPPDLLYGLNGRAQNFFIFGRALSVAERSFLWNAGAGRSYADLDAAFKTELRAWWPLDEPSGSRRDVSGNNNTLTDNNTVGSNVGKILNPIGGDNTPVAIWEDSGPNDFHLYQGAVPGQPTLQINERNGKPVMRFSGASAMVTGASILGSYLSGLQAQSVFIVAAHQPVASNSTYTWLGGQLHAHLPYSGVLYYDVAYSSSRTVATQPEPWFGTWHITEMVRDGVLGSLTIEGNPLTILQHPGAVNSLIGSTDALTIGTGPGGPIVGDIAEFIIFNRTLTVAERDTIRNYLKLKWGIAQNKLMTNTTGTGYLLLNTATNDRLVIN